MKPQVRTRPGTDHFWSLVERRSDSECWLWKGTTGQGYGRYGRKPAHRVAWELFNGRPMGATMFACHHCDNPPCCNPAHIFEGSCADNNRDAHAKGRIPPPYTQYTPAQLLAKAELDRRNKAAFAYARSQGRI